MCGVGGEGGGVLRAQGSRAGELGGTVAGGAGVVAVRDGGGGHSFSYFRVLEMCGTDQPCYTTIKK